VADEPKNNGIQGFIGVGFLAFLAWFFFFGGWEQQTQDLMQKNYEQVSQDFEAQYRIAAQAGKPMDKCVQASIVAAAYLQEQNSQKYSYWKDMETIDCAAAGVPR
jgi:hypothetical protein